MSETTEVTVKRDSTYDPLFIAGITFFGMTALDVAINGWDAVWDFKWWHGGSIGLSEAAIVASPLAGIAALYALKATGKYGRVEVHTTTKTVMVPKTQVTKKEVFVPNK